MPIPKCNGELLGNLPNEKNIGYPDSNPPVCMLIEAYVVMDTGCRVLSADFSK